ncbi:hypothetical protein R4172_04940 [Rhodococcus kroppenstedtii]|uniref:hypothetical protein n=1 Tax=Rhodococcoides kroppenstedtii TaxID=293050 RepID=UPI0029548300|nr:hypothetical protein [Rhodococcus kroppenstedtii]MDV7196906.1 hypothetical protein [Rhodococcus kroppenstedtii]
MSTPTPEEVDRATRRLAQMITDAVAALPEDARAVVAEHGWSVDWSVDPLEVTVLGVPFAYVDVALLTDAEQTGYVFERVEDVTAPDHVPDEWT